uniref:Uncharacterized protein LOC105646572 isoform X1 n=1 Tax=Rhizophora mucronata TaxID=61149 RepID=A0A2P2QLE3_RHIMU
MRRVWLLKNSIAFVSVVISLCCLFVILLSFLRLPDVSLGNNSVSGPYKNIKNRKVLKHQEIGVFGNMMIEMLPEDLAFTVFVPSEEAFDRDLRLRVNSSLAADKRNDTYAIVSRVLGFSAVPRLLFSTMVPSGKLLSYDSLSGFTLFISKDVDDMLVVNRVQSERVDIRRRETVVHVMDGVIMDAEFEQSVQLDYGEVD